MRKKFLKNCILMDLVSSSRCCCVKGVPSCFWYVVEWLTSCGVMGLLKLIVGVIFL